ncbi:flagellar hook protein FlgE [Betaproteobacteria bacterium]|nr:flagellar hook protein FlgE [Betaproteobacteria bacterium]
MAFQQGLSGLKASSKALDVVGNNVANSSTVGFKSSNGHFADVYAASLNGLAGSQVGIGTQLAAVFQQFTQGNITATNNPLDIAINGGGFFNVTRDGTLFYTRNGQFHNDNDGYIINDQNYRLMGYIASPEGVILPSQPEEIRINSGNIEPRPTGSDLAGNVRMVLNLDSSKSEPTTIPFNYQNPLTYTYSTAQTFYDTLGVEHNVTYFFVKQPVPTPPPATPQGEWDVWATLDGANPEPVGTPAGPNRGGLLTFDANGMLQMPRSLALPTTWNITTGAATPLGTDVAGPLPYWEIDFTGTTNFSGESTVNSQYQGGYGQGTLSSVSISDRGIVLGNYSNGQAKVLAQVVLSTFPNMNGLIDMGNNLLQMTSASGEGLVGVPGAGARGVLRATAVEESNVDLTDELVNMITLQRNYQANAQTIKTQDQIMQTLVNMR